LGTPRIPKAFVNGVVLRSHAPTSLVRYEQMSGEYPRAFAVGIKSDASLEAPSIAPWFSGKYT
jgi:hypothetical protein